MRTAHEEEQGDDDGRDDLNGQEEKGESAMVTLKRGNKHKEGGINPRHKRITNLHDETTLRIELGFLHGIGRVHTKTATIKPNLKEKTLLSHATIIR